MADGTSPHEIARLRQAWDQLVAAQPAALDDLDPDLAETVQHLHALYQPPAADESPAESALVPSVRAAKKLRGKNSWQ